MIASPSLRPAKVRPPASPVADAVARLSVVPLTIEQYQRMIEDGIIGENSTAELLRGMLLRKDRSSPGEDPMSHSPRHRLAVGLLTGLAAKIDGPLQHIQIQLPVACPPDGAPEPDAAIIRGVLLDYTERLPGPGDVACVIEASHSSLDRDRDDKLPIYAAAGVPQSIIINLVNDTIEVYTDPDTVSEQYRTKVTLKRSQDLSLELPGGQFVIAASDVLPP
jgi:Uma2 family endonuclease